MLFQQYIQPSAFCHEGSVEVPEVLCDHAPRDQAIRAPPSHHICLHLYPGPLASQETQTARLRQRYTSGIKSSIYKGIRLPLKSRNGDYVKLFCCGFAITCQLYHFLHERSYDFALEILAPPETQARMFELNKALPRSVDEAVSI